MVDHAKIDKKMPQNQSLRGKEKQAKKMAKLAQVEPEKFAQAVLRESNAIKVEKRKFAYPLYFIDEDYHIMKNEKDNSKNLEIHIEPNRQLDK